MPGRFLPKSRAILAAMLAAWIATPARSDTLRVGKAMPEAFARRRAAQDVRTLVSFDGGHTMDGVIRSAIIHVTERGPEILCRVNGG